MGNTSFKSDIEIAQGVKMKPVEEIAGLLGISGDDIELYRKYKAKIDYNILDRLSDK